jgi:hypothetical protein
MFRLVQVRDHERGLWFRRGNFEEILLPGSTWLLNWTDRIEIIDTAATPQLDHPLVKQMIARPSVREQLEIVELSSAQWAMVWRDTEIVSIVGPGRHAFWKTDAKISVETFSITQNVPTEIARRLETTSLN